MSTAEKLAEALEKIAEQHGQWNNGIWAANIALEALAAYRAQPAADGAQRVERMSKKQLNKVIATIAESIDSSNIVMTHWPIVARAIETHLAAAWGVPLKDQA